MCVRVKFNSIGYTDTDLNIRDWENPNPTSVFPLIPVTVDLSDDVDCITFLKGKFPVKAHTCAGKICITYIVRIIYLYLFIRTYLTLNGS